MTCSNYLTSAHASCEACCGESCGRCCGQCFASVARCCLLKIGAYLFVPAILVGAVASGLEVVSVLGLASFCKDAGPNALAYLHWQMGDTAYEVGRFYIEGNGSNPLLDELWVVNDTAYNLSEHVKMHEQLLEANCTDSREAVDGILRAFHSMKSPIHNATLLLSPRNVYPYYTLIVHEKACGSVMSGLAWLATLQYISSIAILPLLIGAAGRYLERHQQWGEYFSGSTERLHREGDQA